MRDKSLINPGPWELKETSGTQTEDPSQSSAIRISPIDYSGGAKVTSTSTLLLRLTPEEHIQFTLVRPVLR